MRKLFLLAIGVFILMQLSAQQQNTDSSLVFSVKQTNNWVFYSPQSPRIDLAVKNTTLNTYCDKIELKVATDKHIPVYNFSQEISLSGKDSANISFTFNVPAPGFYRCTLTSISKSGTTEIRKFNIGYEPEYIVSLPDNQPDLQEFWQKAKNELSAIAPDYKMTLLPGQSTDKRRLYQVSMKSLGNVEISGYYCVPTKKGKFPVIISYMGYGSKPWMPKPNDNPNYAEFVLSVRGQALNEPTNIYDNWITYKLDSKENYYYRGAFMDLIRAIDFVESRPEVDNRNIFAEGGSQGGAFTLAACALDNRIACAAPTIPFLSDYPDYFEIVNWPAEPVRKKQAELNMSNQQLFEVLSYFDIKNLAANIKCPIIMAVGLQDETCPPHTNFSGYNRISAEKQFYIFPNYGHDVPPEWWQIRASFFEKHLKN